MKALVIDPGERAGWATGTITEDGLEVITHGISPLKEMGMAVLKKAGDYDVVVYETFRLRASSAKALIGNDFPTVQLIGMLRLAAWHHNTKVLGQDPVVKNTARKILSHYPDIERRIAGLPKAHDESHDGDALLHLAYYHWKNHR